MIDEQRMHELGQVEPVVPTRPAVEIVTRGQRLRRRRQVTWAAGGVVAVLTVVGAVTQIPRDPEFTAASPPAPGVMPAPCVGVDQELRGPEAAEGIRFLPSWLPPGTEITSTSARVLLSGTGTCATRSAALVLAKFDDTDPSRVERAVALIGPSPLRFNVSVDGPVYERVELRGTEGTLIRYPSGPMRAPEWAQPTGPPFADQIGLTWTEGDGTSWLLNGNDVSAEELIDLANRLALKGAAETPASLTSVSDGFEVVYQRTRRPAPLPAERPVWNVDAVAERGEGAYHIWVYTTAPDATSLSALAGANVRVVTLRGHRAVATQSTSPEGSSATLLWDEAPGVQIEMSGPGDLDTLMRIAESLTHVPPDDPRIRT